MAEWINNATSPQGSWTVLGLGISMALDLGMHRKKSYSNMLKTEAEAWKRAFWYALPSFPSHPSAERKLGV